MSDQQHEPSEQQLLAMERRQKVYDLFYTVFSTADGKAVLDILKDMAWFRKSTHEGEGRMSHIREAREGQRMLVMVIEDFTEKGKTGRKPPKQAQAISHTARAIDES